MESPNAVAALKAMAGPGTPLYISLGRADHNLKALKGKEEEVRGERTEETNASTLVRVTSRVTISPKIHCEQTQM